MRRRLVPASKNRVALWSLATVAIGFAVAPRSPRAQTLAAPSIAAFPLMSATRLQAFTYAASHKLRYLPGDVLVKFKSGVTVARAQRALQSLPSRPSVNALRWTGDVALLHDDTQPDATLLARQLSAQWDVQYAQPNFIRHLDVVPNDPDFTSLQWNFTAIGVPKAWDINFGATSAIIVALIDTGVTVVPTQNLSVMTYVDSTITPATIPVGPSPDLDPARFYRPADFTISTTAPSSVVIDTDGHGTHVASTMAESTNNAIDLAGIAFNARIMPIKVCVSDWDRRFAAAAAGLPKPAAVGAQCSEDAILAGIRYAADNGANVLNISLGGSDPDPAELDALNYAVSKGVFVSVSMGNTFDTGNAAEYPAVYATQIDGMMSVAAVGLNNQHAYYSTTGPQCEISAPGGDYKNGGTPGTIYQVTLMPSDQSLALSFPRFDRYAETPYQGTSMASPHVAGTAALIKSTYPSLTPAGIEKLIVKTALDLGAKGRDNTFGAGLVQPRAALAGSGIVR